MQKKSTFFDHLILGMILAVGVVLFFLFPPSQKRKIIILFTSFSYILWGIWHSTRQDLLSVRVVLEYGLVAVLGAILLWSMM